MRLASSWNRKENENFEFLSHFMLAETMKPVSLQPSLKLFVFFSPPFKVGQVLRNFQETREDICAER